MSHRAGHEFFDEKRDWSRRKDLILEKYLPEYIPRVIHALKKPVCIVDGCAGPGSFGKDDEPGSPRIICDIIQKARDLPANYGYEITPFLVERDPDLFEALRQRLGDMRGIELRRSDFRDCVTEIEGRVTQNRESLFLYLDPWTVEALEWAALDRLFALIDRRHSVEILMNFNVAIFARIGLGAFGMQPPVNADAEGEGAAITNPSIDALNDVAGGTWWLDILRATSDFDDICRQLTDSYCRRLKDRFNEVCVHEIKDKVKAKTPKYVLVFASRSGEALKLMNNAMAAALSRFAEAARPRDVLFEMLPESVVPDRTKLAGLILEQLTARMRRHELVLRVIRNHIALYTDKDIREEIAALIKKNRITSSTGTRTNDDSILQRCQ